MDTDHLRQFHEYFDVLAVIHRLQASDDLRAKMRAEYFDVLRPYPIEAVAKAYETLRRKMKKWPVPADWLEALPPYGSTARLPLADPEDVTEQDAAATLGYEAAHVCPCVLCVAADCFLPPRYVPRTDAGGALQLRRHPTRHGRALVLGRWLHGQELKAWYVARAEFYATDAEISRGLPTPVPLERRMTRLATIARAVITSVTAEVVEASQ